MEFISIILSLTLFYGAIRLFLFYKAYKTVKIFLFSLTFLCYGIGSLLWISLYAEMSMNQILIAKSIFDWFQVAGVSFGLSGMAIENWEDRPPVARFPYVLSFAPLLLIVTYAFVYETFFLRELILSIYEGGALLIGLMLFILFLLKNADYLYVIVGLVLVLLSFVVYWFPSDVIEANTWTWKLITFIGVIAIIHGYIFATKKALELQKAENGLSM